MIKVDPVCHRHLYASVECDGVAAHHCRRPPSEESLHPLMKS